MREESVNKTELIDAIAAHPQVVDKKTAAAVLEATLTEIQNAVTKGDKVSLTGFGVFEKRARAARMARNPRTGEAVKVKKTSVPAFRPGAGFKETVAVGKVAAPAKKAAAKKTTSASTRPAAGKATAAAKTAPAKKTATKSTAKATTAKATAAKKTATKVTAAKAAPAKKTAAAKTTAAKKTVTAKATTAKKAPAKKAAKR
ncbi:HU family DNA-binding protein [Catellatospora bangladeshensis]|uniref:HU family DNA-binding protein n=1 Tax=Catellatospora bangladeshensis TaxID=310355 RepID=UPI0023B24BD5|nr:HU family DNA-binding protein [Catellatospora bangladeshensis]